MSLVYANLMFCSGVAGLPFPAEANQLQHYNMYAEVCLASQNVIRKNQ